jgi:hypothetical protein
MTRMPPKFTPTQRRIIALLADGLPHTRREVFGCLDDDLAQLSAIKRHLSVIRTMLRPVGQDIICELHRRSICYRHVRLLTDPSA